MNAEQLKASVLQLAIEGKLVPQLDSEPAVDFDCEVPEDVPYAVPDKWQWMSLGRVFEMKAGKNIASGEIRDTGEYPCFGGNGQRGFVDKYNRDGRFPLIGRQGALCGNINIASGKFYATEHAVVADSHGLCDVDCAAFFLTAMDLNQYATKTAQPGLSVKRIASVLYPVPPMEEQRRIVARLEEILPIIEEYGKSQEALDKLDEELPAKLKASILQQAIEGKLVPQLDTEPAVDIDCDTPEDVPFSIPEKWKWVALKDVSVQVFDGDHNPPPNTGNGVPLLSAKNIHDGVCNLSEATRWISPSQWESFNVKLHIERDDVLLTIVGTLGRTAVVSSDTKFALQRSVSVIKPIHSRVCSRYLKLVLDSPMTQSTMKRLASGTAQQGVYLKTVKHFLVPLPPLAEQRRIVDRLEELLPEVDKLTARR